MKVSILLPAYNRADVIGWTIHSILSQTVADWELLVAGDGCVDATAEIVTSFNDPRIRWFDLPKAPGVGYANRNLVLRQAEGEMIAYACHDDLWMKDHLARLLEMIETSGADWVCSRPLHVESDGRILPLDFDLRNPRDLASFMEFRECGIPSSCVMHRRSCFEKVGYWKEDIERYADWDMWIRILQASDRPAAFCPTPTCLHFLANWRAVSTVISRLNELPAVPVFAGLNLPKPASEQERAWSALAPTEEKWTDDLRKSVDEVDRFVAASEAGLREDFAQAPIHFFTLRDYRVIAEDDDPLFLLPPCSSGDCRRILFKVSLTGSVASVFQIFYQTEGAADFSEERSFRWKTQAGQNTFTISLAAEGLLPLLRIDPASHAGEYFLHSLEVRGDQHVAAENPEAFGCNG